MLNIAKPLQQNCKGFFWVAKKAYLRDMKIQELKEHLKACTPQLRVDGQSPFQLAEQPTDWLAHQPELAALSAEHLQAQAKKLVKKNLKALSEAQELLYASQRYAVLIIFQAMDAAGKDSAIKHVMSGINPQGCQVFSFKKPTSRDYRHNFLWRSYLSLPEKGRIGIFNRSYYEETIVTRVHPQYLEAQALPSQPGDDPHFWEKRYRDIRNFEQHLHDNGTLVLKFFLHLSQEEQRTRLVARLENPDKHWKYDASDIEERRFWDQYQAAYQESITATSSHDCPWYIMPADHKWPLRAAIAHIITTKIQDLNLSYPRTDPQQIKEALQLLKNEK